MLFKGLGKDVSWPLKDLRELVLCASSRYIYIYIYRVRERELVWVSHTPWHSDREL